MANGSIRCDASGWYYVVDVPNPDGSLGADGKLRRKQEKRRAGSKREAQRMLLQRQLQLEAPPQARQVVLLKDFLADQWLPSMRASISKSTYASDLSSIELHIVPALGNRPLHEITTMEISRFCAGLLEPGNDKRSSIPKGLSPKTIANIFGVLRKAFGAAVRERYLDANPCTGASLPKSVVPPMKVLRWEEIPDFLQLWQGRPERDVVEFAIWTGLRRGEVLGLKFSHIDWSRRYMTVEVSRLKTDGDIYEAPPKTRNSVRVVPLVGRALEIVQTRRGSCDREDDYVFTNKDDAPFDPDNFSTNFSARVGGAAWKGTKVTLHGLRHTFASLALTRFKTDVHALSLIMGHHSAAFTMDTYAHWMPRDLHSAMAGWENPVLREHEPLPEPLIVSKRGWAVLTDDQIRTACLGAPSARVVLQRLNVSQATKNYARLRTEAARLGIVLPPSVAGRKPAA